ncbi:MAG: SLC13 family permease, partial [Deltaproteobacteria bacterium]|nr:SLC13 family permease [Deltaproteobacteria bacterium]
MSYPAWITLATVALVFGLLAFTQIAADTVLVGGLGLLLLTGVLNPSQALAGFANEGMITVGVLFVVATGLSETGAFSLVVPRILGRTSSVKLAQARMMIPTTLLSAFINNTPLVAMLLPVVLDWCKKNRLSPSRLLLPLSYASILGGVVTLIGTSTNLVVNGLMLAAGMKGMRMFDLAWVGLPCAAAGLGFLLLFGRRLLPERISPVSLASDPREYTFEMTVEGGSGLVGKTIEDAGLRHLPGAYIVEIERNGGVLPAVAPQEVLQGGDRLLFAGIIGSVLDLQKTRGLTPATDQVFKLDGPRSTRTLIEAVVSDTFPQLGKTIRESRFRTQYNAVVLAVARNGQRIQEKIGNIRLRAGDTLLLEARPQFLDQQRDCRDFYLVSQLENSNPPRHDRAWASLAIFAGLVLLASLGLLDMLRASVLAAGLMLICRCCRTTVVRRNVNWQVLIAIGAALGLGKAMEVSGAAQMIAEVIMGFAGQSPLANLAAIYLLSMVFTEILTNNAAAALVFPIAKATAVTLDASPLPFLFALTVAASFGFATP